MKTLHLSLAFTMLLVATILAITTINANAEMEQIVDLAEEEKIRAVIQNYFEKRYHSRQVNQIENFRELTDGSAQAEAFLKTESDKLEIEIYNAKLHHLGYTQYKFTLDFNNISIDREDQSATVLLTEGHDVVFEISNMISKAEPIVSKMRNLDHMIVLKKTQNDWKIVSDHYEDYLWRMLRATDLSKDELLHSMSMNEVQDRLSNIEKVQSLTSSCNLQADTSTHSYNRGGALAYAHRYANNPNPTYHYFTDNDCTNFVNQAIHHGSNAEEVGSNTYGWYYNYYHDYQHYDYSASWTNVTFLFEFITEYLVWDKGPE